MQKKKQKPSMRFNKDEWRKRRKKWLENQADLAPASECGQTTTAGEGLRQTKV